MIGAIVTGALIGGGMSAVRALPLIFEPRHRPADVVRAAERAGAGLIRTAAGK